MSRFYLALFIALGLIVLLIVIISGGGGKKPHTPTPVAPLVSMANSNSEVSMTINGPITAEQNHRSIQIIITKNHATYNSILGYNNNVVFTQGFSNTVNSYTAFLSALYQAGYTKGNTNEKLANDVGYCSIGNRYIFETIQSGQTISRFWVSNCFATPRTYLGNLSLTTSLFEAQIPNFNQINSAASLN
ncbi:MAG TPA: hypothetical protein VIH90_01925 [Candidatus Saccharimonadales bacterium]